MSQKINLLPEDLTRGGGVDRLSKLLRKIASVGLFVFIILSAAGALVLFFLTRTLTDTTNKAQIAKENIRNLEGTEEQLILVRDRVIKINLLLEDRSNEPILNKQKEVLESLPSEILFSESKVEQEESSIELSSVSSIAIKDLMNTLKNLELKKLILISMNFNPIVGYQLTFELF